MYIEVEAFLDVRFSDVFRDLRCITRRWEGGSRKEGISIEWSCTFHLKKLND
jgi:hypothetical protein